MKNFIDNLKKNKIDIICVGIIFIIAITLRIIAINNYGALTQDEPYSWRFAQYNSVLEVIKQLTSTDIHMPIYFIFLHFWIKIFGDSYEALHYSSLFLFLPTIPLTFYIVKNLFNKTSAYFTIIFITFNTFCIYYSIFVRFYALLMPLTILFVYLFIKMLENFDKKYVISFIIVHFLMFYTFTLNSILLFFTALSGLHYLIVNNKDIKKYLKIYLIIALISLPGAIIVISNFIATSSAICSHSQEFFFYDSRLISDILENFFSNENFQILTKRISTYRSFTELLNNEAYFFLVAIPIAIGLFGFIKAFFSKNKTVYLMAIPTLLTILATILFAKFDIMYYQTKYLIFAFPIIISIMSYGLTIFKNKCTGIIVFLTYLLIITGYTFTSHKNVLKYHNYDMGYMTSVFYYNDIKNTDLIICPFVPETIEYFYKTGQIIPFALDEAILIKDKKSLEFYFGKENAKNINNSNVIKFLDEYAYKDIPVPTYEKNLYEQYISKMKKGQKLVIINAFEVTTGYCENPRVYFEQANTITNKFAKIMKKGIRDTILIADKYLKKVNLVRNYREAYAIYIYEKE